MNKTYVATLLLNWSFFLFAVKPEHTHETILLQYFTKGAFHIFLEYIPATLLLEAE